MIAAPSLPAALHYLHGDGVVRVWNVDMRRGKRGYVFYFTALAAGRNRAYRVKVCEDARGHVTGSSDMSAGEVDCDTAPPATAA
jgi:hypothetical protein